MIECIIASISRKDVQFSASSRARTLRIGKKPSPHELLETVFQRGIIEKRHIACLHTCDLGIDLISPLLHLHKTLRTNIGACRMNVRAEIVQSHDQGMTKSSAVIWKLASAGAMTSPFPILRRG